MEQKPANTGLRSQYSLRLYRWAKKYVKDGARTTSLEELRSVLGLESIKDAEGNVIHEAPLPVWANFQQRALDVAILEINTKTDLMIKLASTERRYHTLKQKCNEMVYETLSRCLCPGARPSRHPRQQRFAFSDSRCPA
jgi:hypothetical protein